MSFLTSSTGADSILPGEYASLVIDPVTRDALAFQQAVATTVSTSSHDFHIPVLREDAGAAWVAEGAEITPDDPTLDELTVTPAKVAGLTIISRELASDSSPAAAELVGQSIARSIVDQVDRAFTGDLAAPAPKGLASLTGATPVSVVAESIGEFGRGPFAAAVSEAESRGANVTAWLANPVDALALAKVNDQEGSLRPLLDDPRRVLDRPVIVNKHVAPGTVYGVDRSRVYTVLREDVTIAVSDAPYFSSDRIAVRATMRIGFAFPTPSTVVRITRTNPAG